MVYDIDIDRYTLYINREKPEESNSKKDQTHEDVESKECDQIKSQHKSRSNIQQHAPDQSRVKESNPTV